MSVNWWAAPYVASMLAVPFGVAMWPFLTRWELAAWIAGCIALGTIFGPRADPEYFGSRDNGFDGTDNA